MLSKARDYIALKIIVFSAPVQEACQIRRNFSNLLTVSINLLFLHINVF